jgi:hypothetical protein
MNGLLRLARGQSIQELVERGMHSLTYPRPSGTQVANEIRATSRPWPVWHIESVKALPKVLTAPG